MDVNSQASLPSLRFREFSGDWVLGVFSDFVKGFTSGSTPSRSVPAYFLGDIPWVNSGDLDYNTIYTTPQSITERAVVETNLTIHQPGTFLMAITGLEAAGTRGSCAILGVPAATNQSCMALIARNDNEITFFYQHYLSVGQRYAFRFCQGTKQQSYNGRLVRNLPIAFPPQVSEQVKIAEFLTAVDERIAKLKRKKVLLEEYKKGMMQKLFSQEIRFKDEDGNDFPVWEMKSLDLLVEPVKRRSETTELPVLTISAKHGFVSQKERFSQVIAGDSLPKYTHLRQDELSYNRGNSKTFPFGCVFKLRVKSALIPNVYKSFRCIQADPDFLEQFFANGGLNKQLRRVITSGARSNGLLNISDSSFYSCKVSTPTPTEQERIGVFLVELDRKVSSLSNQIEKGQEFKRGLLQKMFV